MLGIDRRPVLAALLACLGCMGLAAAGDAAGLRLQEITPARSDDVLINPGMGIYEGGTLNPDDMPSEAWFSRVISIGYFRDDWAELEPDGEGQYRFDEYFGPIFDLWVNKWGKRVAFRFMSSNMHSRRTYVTPKWVFDAGVPSVTHKGLYVDKQVDPVFWDERYLAIQERFIADLGKYLDGRPGLEFIDIGSIGEWGEMHLSRWTSEELAETGYTDEKYIAAYRRIIDAFARAFPHTRVFLNVGDFDAINDYAALRGLHFRQDGLTPSGPSADVGKRFYHPYSRRGVICNYEFHSGYREMQRRGWGIRETFEKGLEDPISYLHINLAWYNDLLNPPPGLREAILDAARRVGFRFVLTRLKCNETVRVGAEGGRLLLMETWRNEGVAPCYDSYALRWYLVGQDGRTAATAVTFPRQPTTLWWPGEEVALNDRVSIPADVAPGRYRLKVAMVKPEQPGLVIQLGLAGRDDQGRYDLGEITVERAERGPEVVYSEGFDAGAPGWTAAPGMRVGVDPAARSGAGCLLVSGEEPGRAWNYAWVRVAEPVMPFSRYRLSCWMRVDAIEPRLPPYVKLGVYDAAGRWLTNFSTDQYDLDKMGTWQHLVGYVETPGDAAIGDIAVEKGVLDEPVRATIRLDDVQLELLESP